MEQAVLRLSRSRRLFAPLALGVGAVVALFDGVKLLFTNWRLTLIQVLPAMWIWLAMLDLKAHVLRGKSFHVVHGPVVIPLVLAVAAITAACFFLNAVFAFAIAGPGPPVIRPAFTRARSSLAVVLGWGTAVGLCLGVSTVVLVRWGSWWFAVSLSIVIAVMMVCYVAVPARLVGMKTTHSKRDKLTLTAVGGAISAVVAREPSLPVGFRLRIRCTAIRSLVRIDGYELNAEVLDLLDEPEQVRLIGHPAGQHRHARKPLQPHAFKQESERIAQLPAKDKPVPAALRPVAVHVYAASHSGRGPVITCPPGSPRGNCCQARPGPHVRAPASHRQRGRQAWAATTGGAGCVIPVDSR